uniref:hypothetical protein n=1 Tax=Haloprofundus sp. MHR1 TaxID=2572921 RepID=UPI001F47A8B4|nr:hypothetical protein [Haloprofundus sp. MHR1]
MHRRALLATLASVGAGCLSSAPKESTETETQTAPKSPTQTEKTATAAMSDPIELDVHNETEEPKLCQYSIRQGSDTILDGEIEVPASDFTPVDTGIEETGEYELNVAVDDIGQNSYPFSVGNYDLRMGSNLVIWIYENQIQMGMEE